MAQTALKLPSSAYPADLDEKFRLGLGYHQRYVQSIQSIGTKGIALLALASVVLSLASTGRFDLELVQIPVLPVVLFLGGLTCFVASAFSSIMSLWIRGLKDGPSVLNLLNDYWDAEGDDLKYNILYWVCQWEAENARLLRSKANWLRAAMVAAVLEVVFLALWLAAS